MAQAALLFKASPGLQPFILKVYHGTIPFYHTVKEYTVFCILSRKTTYFGGNFFKKLRNFTKLLVFLYTFALKSKTGLPLLRQAGLFYFSTFTLN